MSPGIRPSLDRQDQRATMVVGSIILIAMFIAAMYVVVGRTLGGKDGGDPAGAGGGTRLEAYLAEEERASAYAAVRAHLDQMAGEPGIDAVFCRDCSHRWIDDVIEFQGQVDFQRDTGDMESHHYTARLTGSRQDGWEVLSVEIAGEEESLEGRVWSPEEKSVELVP